MKLNDRQQHILTIIEKNQRVTVSQLAQRLYVSEMTIRRDLDKMEQEGLLQRYHGGAVANTEYMQYPIDLRMHINEKEKRDVAKQAQAYIQDGQTIFLPGSSTCAFLIPCLKNYSGLRIVTNSIQFTILLSKMRIPAILSGGEYSESDKILVGHGAERFLRSMNFDIAFLACDGISQNGTVTVKDEQTAEIVRIGFEHSQKRVILADRSKLGSQYTYNICNSDEADAIIVV